MEVSTNLGRVSLVPRGAYDPAADYRRLDVVQYQGSGYLVLRPVRGAAPVDGADYMLLAEKGGTGATGPKGETGNKGEKGDTGDKGEKGDTGEKGEKGDTGDTGPKGDTGSIGPIGPIGPDGDTGNGIEKIERTAGNGAAGTTDTYTITLTDSTTFAFHVYNGADGKGAGDMTAIVYDPGGKKQDIFAYADRAAAALLPVIHAAALEKDAWSGTETPYTQTLSVPGVLEDPLRQIIHPSPADAASLTVWNASGVRCTAQGNGTLAFSARDRPEADILLQIAVQAARSYEGGTNP